MRRLPFALAALVLGLAAACGSQEEPDAATTTAAVTPPAATELRKDVGREDLPSLAVGLADLPEGFSVRREGFIGTGAPLVAGYRRAFDPGEARLGTSLIAGLTSDVVLYESADVADAGLATILAALLGGDVEGRFADIVRASVGIEATNIQGQTLATESLGDGAVVSRATFDTDAGRAEAAFVVVRVGPVHEAVFLIGQPGEVQLDDATNLVRAVLPRLQEAAGGQFAA